MCRENLSSLSWDEWKWQTVSLMELRVGVSWVELCGDDECLLGAFNHGWLPREFCDWFITKYDLIEWSDIDFGG